MTTIDTNRAVEILSQISTRDEAGTHFTQRFSAEELASLQAEGYLTISSPTHPSGLKYGIEQSRCEISADGLALIEANPEYAV